MIKRRFYRAEHGEKDEASSDSSSSASSSSSDESENEPQFSDSDDDVHNDANGDDDDGSLAFKPQYPSSGYESDDSSGNEVDADTTGLITRDDGSESESDRDQLNDSPAPVEVNIGTVKTSPEDLPVAEKVPIWVLKCKEVYKCRLCPKNVCLNEESLMAHLKSKRHARSEKLLNNGKLKRFLNSEGEEELVTDDDGETHAERHARIVAMTQSQDVPKKTKGRQRQRQRLKRKKQKDATDTPKPGAKKESRAKRRKKNID